MRSYTSRHVCRIVYTSVAKSTRSPRVIPAKNPAQMMLIFPKAGPIGSGADAAASDANDRKDSCGEVISIAGWVGTELDSAHGIYGNREDEIKHLGIASSMFCPQHHSQSGRNPGLLQLHKHCYLRHQQPVSRSRGVASHTVRAD
jgi:hypothetical protein